MVLHDLSMTLTQCLGCGIDKQKLIVCRIKWEPLNQSLQNLVAISLWSCSYVPLVMFIAWLDLWGILLETSFFANFSLKISYVFFQGQTLYWT